MHAGSLGRLAAKLLPARHGRHPAAGRSRKRTSAAEFDVMGGLCVAVYAAFMLAFLVCLVAKARAGAARGGEA